MQIQSENMATQMAIGSSKMIERRKKYQRKKYQESYTIGRVPFYRILIMFGLILNILYPKFTLVGSVGSF